MTTNDIDAIRKQAEAGTSNSNRSAVGSPARRSNDPCTDISAIRARVPAVYDGPWYVQLADDGRWLVGYPSDNPKAGLIATVPDYGEHLAEFIAAARTLVPALCDEVEQLRAQLSTVRALAEGPEGEGDFGSVPAGDILAAIDALPGVAR